VTRDKASSRTHHGRQAVLLLPSTSIPAVHTKHAGLQVRNEEGRGCELCVWSAAIQAARSGEWQPAEVSLVAGMKASLHSDPPTTA